jgi:hypothetical protein
MSSQLADPTYQGDLGNGLIRRWSTAADQPKIGQCLATVFRPNADAPLNVRSIDEVRILMSGAHPFMGPGDFAIVEDTNLPERPVVACTCCWSHTWSYAGIPFGVGQPELVATLPEYRNRGLVRALFEMAHARSAAKGEMMQVITGIPYFYRQFGYEYAIDLEGHRTVAAADAPARKEDEPEPYSLRLATVDDIPHLQALYNQERDKSLLWHELDEGYWRAHITSWDDPAIQGKDVTQIGMIGPLRMIVEKDGAVCGYIWLATKRWGSALRVFALQLYPHVNWQQAMPSLLRACRAHGEQTPGIRAESKPFSEISFGLGRSHPAYSVLGEKLAPRGEPPYAWYVRVADVPGFVRHIAPVLEDRLAASIATGHTGELAIDLYRGGLRLQFEQGKLAAAEPWRQPDYGDDPPAGCPPLVFLQLLLGYRSLAELRATFPDVYAEPEAALLLDILFPKQMSMMAWMSYT